MNRRHATALALLGWYLIMPPVEGMPPAAVPKATFDRWHTMNVFDSVADCQKEKGQYNSLTASELQIDPKAYFLGERPKDPTEAQKWDSRLAELKSALVDAAHHAGCIASDDPRLKGR
jgi:hypothetical protein